jgi:DNA-directed RNA polymerase subunit RPC12/RpoP
MLPAFVAFVPFFVLLLFWMTRRPKRCPECGERLPVFQSPLTKSWRQWVEGGYVCRKCGCEADIAGRKVPAGTLPRARSLVLGIVLLATAAVPAVILVALLLQR